MVKFLWIMMSSSFFLFRIFLNVIGIVFYQFFERNFKKITKTINIVSPRCSHAIFYSGIYRLRNMYRISNLFLRKPFLFTQFKKHFANQLSYGHYYLYLYLTKYSYILDSFYTKSHIKNYFILN